MRRPDERDYYAEQNAEECSEERDLKGNAETFEQVHVPVLFNEIVYEIITKLIPQITEPTG